MAEEEELCLKRKIIGGKSYIGEKKIKRIGHHIYRLFVPFVP